MLALIPRYTRLYDSFDAHHVFHPFFFQPLQLFLDWGKDCQLSGFSDFFFCVQGFLVGFLEMKVFFYKNYFPQVAITNLSLSAGASGSWSPSVLDGPTASHLAGAMWNGFDIFRCQTVSSNKLITDKGPVTAGSSLDALYQMLEHCRDSLNAQLAALTLEPGKGNGGKEGEGGGGKRESKGPGSKGGDKSNGGTATGKGRAKKDGSGNSQTGSKTRKALQSVSLSTLNILLQNLEYSGDDFNQYF